MNKLLVICGPTAVGKTSLGIKLAERFSGEVVSADSRQVYKYMDIGTGKDLPVNSKFQIPNFKFQISNYKIGYYEIDGVKVWLLDVVEPDYQFSVADYVKCANLVIKDIWERGKLPILVGGTGFYVKAVIDRVETIGVKPDWRLRKKLQNSKMPKLQEMLRNLDTEKWEGMNQSDRSNPRRLIRAIEIAKQTQNSKLKVQDHNLNLKTDKILFIGLMVPNEVLYQRIDKRVNERVKEGIVEEIKELLKKEYTWENSVLGQTIGYKEWKEYFKNSQQLTINNQLKEVIIQRWKYAEHGYARRQMTWFKKDKRIHWFDISEKGWENEVERLIEKWFHH